MTTTETHWLFRQWDARTAGMRDLLAVLGRDPSERITVCHKPVEGAFTVALTTVEEAPNIAGRHTDVDCWYSTQPLHIRVLTGRGQVADVVGIRELPADLDVKPGGMPDYDAAASVVTTLTGMLGVAPVAVVSSGHGLQPHWAIERGPGTDWPDDTDPAWSDAVVLLRRWGRLVARAAELHGGHVDNVYDLARVLRVPGTTNRKDPTDPRPTKVNGFAGAPVSLEQIRDCLDEYNVPEVPEDREQLGDVVAPASGWRYADRNCGYVATMVAGWASDTPTARHPWLVSQAARLAAAHRLGCINETAHEAAAIRLADRFRALLTTGDARSEGRGEIHDALAWGVTRVETMTDTRASHELGDHQHVDEVTVLHDHPDFWCARPALGHIRDFAQARRTSPWATLGAVLAMVITKVGPDVQLPPLTGKAASLNLFVALVGPSGSGKDAAIGVAADAVDVGDVPVRKPGSGEGIAHIFVHRTKDGSGKNTRNELVQHATEVLFVASEVDQLTALVSRQASTLASELRIAFMGQALGFAYVDPVKNLDVKAHTYRLSLIVGVQPERAGALLDDRGAGTPQRFVWLPATDPDAPNVRPVEPDPLTWTNPTLTSTAGTFSQPGGPRLLDVCDTAKQIIDDARLDRHRGNGHALDGHALLTRLKVAAAVGLLDGHMGVTDEDWALAGTVMDVSDHTRGEIEKVLAEKRAAVNRARGRDEAERALVVGERTEEAAIQKVIKWAVDRLGKEADGMIGSDLRRALDSKRREHLDEAVGRAVKAGLIEVETVTGTGQAGQRYRCPR